MTTIKDDYGKEYEVSDLKAFKSHLEKYHAKNGRGDEVYMKKMDIGFVLLKIFMII